MPSDQTSFAALVLSFAHTAAMYFGDILDPVSGAANRSCRPR